ncbi:MAG: hypothetical protein QXU26_04190 [Thermofilaceae archaeon]
MLYIVPELPVRNRYQEWITAVLEEELRRRGIEYEVVYPREPVEELTTYFTNEPEAIDYALGQVRTLLLQRRLGMGDIVFWMDIDFPGFAVPAAYFVRRSGAVNVGMVHGAYFNPGDYWYGQPRRDFMRAAITVCETVMVATKSFRDALMAELGIRQATKFSITGLPLRTSVYREYASRFGEFRRRTIAFKGEIPTWFRSLVSTLGYDLVEASGLRFEEYLELLATSAAVALFKKSETFGYTLVEALALGTPVLTNGLPVYAELAGYTDGRVVTLAVGPSVVHSFLEEFGGATRERVWRGASRLLEWVDGSASRIADVLEEFLE